MTQPRRILICGATSAIASELAQRLAAPGTAFLLVGRNSRKLHDLAGQLVRQGASVDVLEYDLRDRAHHVEIVERAGASGAAIDLAVVAHGIFTDDGPLPSPESFAMLMDNNFSSAAEFLLALAPSMAKSGHGTIAILSSVAGDRGKARNFSYSCSKASLTFFAECLGHVLAGSDVRVLNVRLGLIVTPMTAGIRLPFYAIPARSAARLIARAIAGNRTDVYIPRFWAIAMLLVRLLPVALFRRLPL